MYRQLLHLSKQLPSASKRPEAVTLVRDRFRAHAAEIGQAKLGKLMAEAESRLGFLKMMTPRSAHRGGGVGGSTRILYHGGEKIDAGKAGDLGKAEKARWSNWTGSNMDPDSVAKHKNLLGRAGFTDNLHAKGIF